MTTATTALRAWIPLINLNDGSTVPLSFVDKLARELAPVDIANCFSEFSILGHVFYAQTFTANHLIIVYQLGSQFVGEVATTISNFCLVSADIKFAQFQ